MATTSIPAPIGGWNARDPLEGMAPEDAVELVNFFPQPGAVYGRGGSLTKLTVASGHPVDTLIPFTSSTQSKFLAAANGNIYDITDLTTPVSKASGFTSDQWQFAHFNDKCVLLNGADGPQIYDGSTVAASTISLPGSPTVALAQAPGTLVNGTYAYRVTATYTGSETAPSTETSITISQVSTPAIPTLTKTGAGDGQSVLGPGTYYYRITAYNSAGETLGSTETSITWASGYWHVILAWTSVTGAAGYKVYGRATGAEQLIADVGNVNTYDDTGHISPSGALPVTNTTSGGVTLTWDARQNPTGYKVYGRTAAGELLMATLASNVTTWTDNGSVTPSGAMPSSDNTGKNLFAVANAKGRAIYIEYRRAGFWYAAAGAFQGNLSWFPLDFVFHNGGYCVNVVTWSRDNGDGVDDMTAFISSNGEALVYQGNDPGSALTWSLVGRFNIGVPLSTRAHGKMASAEIILTTDGFLTMDEAIVNQRAQELQTFGGKIIRAANWAAGQYGSNFGWECCYYPRGNMFIVNVPVNGTTQMEQYVQNTNTGAWCRFTGWNARTFGVFGNRLYFGTYDGKVLLADTSSADTTYGFGDDGVAVEHRALTSYQKFADPGTRSQVTAVEIVSNMADPNKADVKMFQDYRARSLRALTDATELTPGQWDVSSWDSDYWADSNQVFDPTSQDARLSRYSTSSLGHAQALSYRYQCKRQMLTWYASNFITKQAGV